MLCPVLACVISCLVVYALSFPVYVCMYQLIICTYMRSSTLRSVCCLFPSSRMYMFAWLYGFTTLTFKSLRYRCYIAFKSVRYRCYIAFKSLRYRCYIAFKSLRYRCYIAFKSVRYRCYIAFKSLRYRCYIAFKSIHYRCYIAFKSVRYRCYIRNITKLNWSCVSSRLWIVSMSHRQGNVEWVCIIKQRAMRYMTLVGER